MPRAWRTTLVTALVIVVAAAAATWIQVIERLHAPDPVAVRGTPASIVWSDRVFSSEAELAAWLRRRGIDYGRWVRSHPAAVAILRPHERAAAVARPSATSGTRVRTVARRARAGRADHPQGTPKPAQHPSGAVRSAPPTDGGSPLVTVLLIAIGAGSLAPLVPLAMWATRRRGSAASRGARARRYPRLRAALRR
jgi:hypothetical protein